MPGTQIYELFQSSSIIQTAISLSGNFLIKQLNSNGIPLVGLHKNKMANQSHFDG
jgi:hypothetical protein